MKRVPWRVWVTAVALFMLLFDVMAFGGVATIPGGGKAAAYQASRQKPLTHTYMFVGQHLIDALPALRAPARSLAESVWKDALPVMREQPYTAADRMFDSARGPVFDLLLIAFWGAPLTLLMAVVGWMRRPRKVRLGGSSR